MARRGKRLRTLWGSRLPPARWLAEYRAELARGRPRRRRHACGLRDPGFARLCGTRRAAAAGRRVRLSARRARLRAPRVVAPARGRADVRDLADGRRHGRADGGRRRAALRADRQPRRLHRRGALPDRLAAAAERAGEADQRQHAGRLQGRRRADHRDDAAASLLGVAGGGHNFFERALLLVGQLGQTTPLVLAVGVSALVLLVSRRAPAARPAGRARRGCAVDRRRLGAGASALGVPVTGEIPAGLPALRARRLRLRDVEGIVPLAAGCLLLAYIESVSAGAPSRQSTATRSIRARSCSASARRTSRRRWGRAIRSPAACRNRR